MSKKNIAKIFRRYSVIFFLVTLGVAPAQTAHANSVGIVIELASEVCWSTVPACERLDNPRHRQLCGLPRDGLTSLVSPGVALNPEHQDYCDEILQRCASGYLRCMSPGSSLPSLIYTIIAGD